VFVLTVTHASAAANDSHIQRERCRTLPITESVTSVPGYPAKLVIFQTHASRFWQVRCFFGRTVIRSLRTTHRGEALRLARQWFHSQLAQTAPQITVAEPAAPQAQHGVLDLIAPMLRAEQARCDRGEITHKCWEITQQRANRHITEFFQDRSLKSVTGLTVGEFVEFLTQQGMRSPTISQYLTVLRKMLTRARHAGWIDRLPEFPSVKLTSQARGHFSVQEYWLLLRTARGLGRSDWIVPTACHRSTAGGIYTMSRGIPRELGWAMGFMVNSFVRPVDIKVIQHQHVEIVRGEHTYLRLRLPETKRHRAQVITLPAAVHIYERLREYQARQGYARPQDYLFLPQVRDRQGAMWLLDKFFGQVLDVTGLRLGRFGQRRTLYSLRHSAITFRLLYGRGIDLLTLARNARTSTQMIDRFYASELSAEMNVAMLHSRR
jgi:hypothetical protein